MGGRGIAGLLLLFLACLAVFFSRPADASHAAYGTILWERHSGFSESNCLANSCRYTVTLYVAIRLNYCCLCGSVVRGSSSNCIGSMYGYDWDQGATATYWSTTAYVTPTELFQSDNYFLATGTWTVNFRRGKTLVVWNLCCRLSTLMESNRDRNSQVPSLLSTDFISSHTSTGTHRVYAENRQQINFRIPYAPMPQRSGDPEWHYRFYRPPTSGGTSRGQSALLRDYPSFCNIDEVSGIMTWRPDIPTIINNDGNNRSGLFALQVQIWAGRMTNNVFQKEIMIPLDFIIQVVNVCTNCHRGPQWVSTFTSWPFYRGIEGSFIVEAIDDAGHVTEIQPSSTPPEIVITSIRGGSNPQTRVRWTPKIDSGPAVVCFTARCSAGISTLSQYCVNMNLVNSHLIYVSGIIRDFKRDHPDFAVACSSCDNGVKYVDSVLGPDDKPVRNSVSAPSVTRFDQWYNDVPNVNQRTVHTVILSNGSVPDGRVFTYSSEASFFPIDGRLFGNEGMAHNFYFTYEIHTYIVYQGGEQWEFKSSDDLLVYINRRMDPGWNLHGIHQWKSYTMNMDSLANLWSLELEEIYTCDIFWAHRSANHNPGLQLQLPNAVLCDALSSGILTISNPTFTDREQNLTLVGRSAVVPRASGVPAHSPAGDVLQLIGKNHPNDGGAAYWREFQVVDGVPGMYSSEQKVLQGFATTFDFVINQASAVNPEGFAFVFQSEGPDNRGNDGSGLGYDLLAKSLAIEFDTRTQGTRRDPSYQHVSMHTRYGLPNSAHHDHSLAVSDNDPPMSLTNNSIHRIRIEYSPAKDDTNSTYKMGWVRVWMNDVVSPVMIGQVDDIQLRTHLGGVAYVGFTTGSSEAESTANIVLYNWNMVIVPPSAGQSSIVDEPLAMAAGTMAANTYAQDQVLRAGQLVVQLRDSCGNMIPIGSEPDRFTFTVTRRIGSPNPAFKEVLANHDGTYTLRFNPTEMGWYDLDVLFDSTPIENNPFEVNVFSGPSTVENTAIIYGRFPVGHTNAPYSVGLVVGAFNPTSGLPILDSADVEPKQFNFHSTGSSPSEGPDQFVAYINSLPANTIVAIACSGDCQPRRNTASINAVETHLGCGDFRNFGAGHSYACVSQKGNPSIAVQEHSGSYGTSLLELDFTDIAGNVFTVVARSTGTAFGYFGAGEGYVNSIPATVVVEAATDSVFYISARDQYGNQQVANSDNFDVYFDPDIRQLGGQLTDAVATSSPGYHEVSWNSVVAGVYSLYVRMDNVIVSNLDISNSPMGIQVIAGPASSLTSLASGPGISQAQATVESCFELNLRDEFDNIVRGINAANPDVIVVNLVHRDTALNQRICNPDDNDCNHDGVNVHGTVTQGWVGQIFTVCYTPWIAGDYDVLVEVNGGDLVDTDGDITTVIPGPIWGRTTEAYGQATTTAVAGQSQSFLIQAKDKAGNNILIQPVEDITVTSVPNIAPSVAYEGQGLFRVTYTPTAAGPLSMHITVNLPDCSGSSAPNCASGPEDKTIGDLGITVLAGLPSEKSQLIMTSGQEVVAGETSTYDVIAIDINDNPIVDGVIPGNSFTHRLRTSPDEGSFPVDTLTFGVEDQAQARYRAQWQATRAGTYFADVVVTSSGLRIQNVENQGTFYGTKVTVVPATFHCESTLVEGRGQYGGDSGQQALFTVSPRDQFQNLQLSSFDPVITVAIDGDSGAGNGAVITKLSGESAVYEIDYTVPQCGSTFNLALSIDGCEVMNNDVPCSLDGTNVYARPECGYEIAQAGVEHKFCIIDYLNSVPDEQYRETSWTFMVNIQDGQYIQRNVRVSSIADHPDVTHNFTVSYTPERIGTYTLDLTSAPSGVASEHNPFTIVVKPGELSPPHSSVHGLNNEAFGTNAIEVGTPVVFYVDPRDKFGNLVAPDPEELQIIASTKDGDDDVVIIGTWDVPESMYKFTHTFEVAEEKSVLVTYEGQAIPGSAHDLQTKAAPAHHSRMYVHVIGNELIATAGVDAAYTLHSLDRFGNLAGQTVDIPELDQFLTRSGDSTRLENVEIATNFKGASEYTLTMNSEVASPFGTNPSELTPLTLNILYDGEHISGSPYDVIVNPAQADKDQSSVTGLDEDSYEAGKEIEFKIIVRDRFGNPWTQTGGRLVTAQTRQCNDAACTDLAPGYEISVQHETSGEFAATVPGLRTRTAGQYIVTFIAGGKELETTKADRMYKVVSGPPSASHTRIPISIDPVALAGIPISLTITLRDEFGNPVFGDEASDGQDLEDFVDVSFTLGSHRCAGAGGGNETWEVWVPERFVETVECEWSSGDCTISVTSTIMDDYTLRLYIDEVEIPCTSTERLHFRVDPGLADPDHSSIDGPEETIAGSHLTYTIEIRDAYGNTLRSASLDEVQFGEPPSDPSTLPVGFGDQNTWVREDHPGVHDLDLKSHGNLHLQAAIFYADFRVTVAGTYWIVSTLRTGEDPNYAFEFIRGDVLPPVDENDPPQPKPSVTQLVVKHAAPYTFRDPDFPDIAAGHFGSFILTAEDVYGNVIQTPDHEYEVSFVRTGAGVAYTYDPPVENLGDGTHQVTYRLEWAGRYDVRITLVGGANKRFEVTVHHQACGWDIDNPDVVGPKPYRCPDSKVCVADYLECEELDEDDLCDASTPVRCGDTCVKDASLCPCSDTSLTRCPAGNCAASCPGLPLCPAGTEPCKNAAGDSTGECRVDPNDCPSVRVCTPGLVLCDDGYTCAHELSECVPPPVCDKEVQCPNGACVSSLEECPTQTTCPDGQVVCASDGRCVDSPTECVEQYECLSGLRCPDGSCRDSMEQCPSHLICPLGQVLCPNGHCAGSSTQCVDPAAECPLNQIRCTDGSCVENILHCPSVPSCPEDHHLMCPDRTCVDDLGRCNPAPEGCASHAMCRSSETDTVGTLCFLCWDGTCVLKSDADGDGQQDFHCPTAAICPSDVPVRCPNGECVADTADCPRQPACGLDAPVRCPDGSCSKNLQDCPSQSACPSSLPIRCSDGQCTFAVELCPDQELLVCPEGRVKCPGGECAVALSLCPTHTTCPPGSQRCIDGSCRGPVPGCPQDGSICTDGKIACPQSHTGVQCANRIEDCPQNAACPAELPVQCLDRTCANTVLNCPPIPTDPGNRFACPDGSWVSSQYECNTPVTCTPDAPFKCRDETCRIAPADCPVAEAGACGDARPYLCPNGVCAEYPHHQDCNSDTPSCPAGRPVRCPDNVCVETAQACEQDHSSPEKCPHDYVRCNDGVCRMENNCPVKQCPVTLPHLCADGLCVAAPEDCTLSNGCPPHLHVKCLDGLCASSVLSCNTYDPSICGPGFTFCSSSGACVAENSGLCDTYDENGCPLEMDRCLDGTCVDKPFPGEPSECVAGDSPYNSCPIGHPYRCPNGLCVTTSLMCPPSIGGAEPCPEEFPVRCASGSCVLSNVQCPIIRPCEDDETRCDDGTCFAQTSLERCSAVNTCPFKAGTTEHQIRCPEGLCANSQADCINLTTGCPTGMTVCSNGLCVNDEAECEDGGLNPNGCQIAGQVRCPYTGECVAALKECTNQVGCLAELEGPYRCPNGECVWAPEDCQDTVCDKTICADGSCKPAADCKASNQCPADKPIRCANGECARYSANSGMPVEESCPVGVRCNEGEMLCANGVCVPEDSELCPRVPICPTGQVLCRDLSCAPTQQDCPQQCPVTMPVRCPNGLCRATPSECQADRHNADTCRDPTPFRCADGRCFASQSQCVEWMKEVHESDSLQGICEGKVECPSYVLIPHHEDGTCNPVVCPDGSCAANIYLCKPVGACRANSIRCPDGSCVSAAAGQGAEVCTPPQDSCGPREKRCEDGTCRTECLPYHGCGLDLPFHCPNRECASRNDPEECAARLSASPTYQRIFWDTSGGAETFALEPQAGERALLQETSCDDKDASDENEGNSTLPAGIEFGWSGPPATEICAIHRWRFPGDYRIPAGRPCRTDCNSMVRAITSAYTVDPNVDATFTVAADSSNIPRARLTVPASAFLRTDGTATPTPLAIREVAESRIRPVANRVVYIRRQFHWDRYMGFSETLLSPAFECVTPIEVHQPFRVNITYAADYDVTRYPDLRDICLAYVHTINTGLYAGYQWRCVHGEDHLHVPVLRGEDKSRVVGSFGVCGPAGTIYGFIHSPTWLPVNPPPRDTNWFVDNLLWIILGLAGLFVLVFIILYVLKRMRRYRAKYHEERDEVDRAQEEVDTMMQFGGRAGAKDEEVAMTDNPLVTQMEDMQKRLDDNAMELQQAQLEEQQMESEERQEHIHQLKDDRNELQEELERLKAQLNESTAASVGTLDPTHTTLDFADDGLEGHGQRRTDLGSAGRGGRRKRDM